VLRTFLNFAFSGAEIINIFSAALFDFSIRRYAIATLAAPCKIQKKIPFSLFTFCGACRCLLTPAVFSQKVSLQSLAYGFLDEVRRGRENARSKMDFSKYVQRTTRAFSFRFSRQPSQEKTFCLEFVSKCNFRWQKPANILLPC